MFTEKDTKHWRPLPDITKHIASLIAEGSKVLEIGPGDIVFPRANHFVDRSFSSADDMTICDVDRQFLPFADKSFDFIYCRHVIEDLHNPALLLSEMSRVGKAGYIETPSPLAEMARGIDGTSPYWRGYHHHRWLVWNRNGMLATAGKYPIIEYVDLIEDTKLYEDLRNDPLLWNSYYLWKDKINWLCLQHGPDFHLPKNYKILIENAIKESKLSSKIFHAYVLRKSRLTSA